MSGLTLTLVLFGVVLNAAGQLLLKAGTREVGHFDFTPSAIAAVAGQFVFSPWISAGILCYLVSLGVWILALSRVPVSIAYPMLSLGYVINALVAHTFLQEPMNLTRAAGIGIILLGVLLVARS